MSSSEETSEETKQYFREKIWTYLEANNLADFPRPVYNRIPNFKQAAVAAHKLKELDIFAKSCTLKVNPDKPQETVRMLALESGKTVLVPIPRLRKGLFQKIEVPPGSLNKICKIAASRRGFGQFGKPLGLDAKVKIDLIVLGSVAVSKEGYRIGKGEGFADLEYAIMASMGAVSSETVIITTVHDCQVFDTLPKHLFKEHDVPVDIIITPTQVFHIESPLSRPTGIMWHILSSRRLKEMPILQTLRDQQKLEGKDCTLKEIDSDEEDNIILPNRRPFISNREVRCNNNNYNDHPVDGNIDDTTKNGIVSARKKSRSHRRRRHAKLSANFSDLGITSETAKECTSENQKPSRYNCEINTDTSIVENSKEHNTHSHRPRRRQVYDCSLKLNKIGVGVRIRDIKAALAEKGVRPAYITLQSARGFAILHFRKPELSESTIAALQDLKLERSDFMKTELPESTDASVQELNSDNLTMHSLKATHIEVDGISSV